VLATTAKEQRQDEAKASATFSIVVIVLMWILAAQVKVRNDRSLSARRSIWLLALYWLAENTMSSILRWPRYRAKILARPGTRI
jgi:hypothetical protein